MVCHRRLLHLIAIVDNKADGMQMMREIPVQLGDIPLSENGDEPSRR